MIVLVLVMLMLMVLVMVMLTAMGTTLYVQPLNLARIDCRESMVSRIDAKIGTERQLSNVAT